MSDENTEVEAAVQETERLQHIKADVKRWRAELQDSARLAVEAIAKVTPIGEAAPSLDEQSKILGEAVHAVRELVRPEPKTVAFLEEHGWYHVHSTYHTPKAAVDFVLGNPPFGTVEPGAKPLSPDAPELVPGEERHMSRQEAVKILIDLARKRSMSVDQVTAIEMAVRRIMVRYFQVQRNWARRRLAKQQADDNKTPPRVAPLSPDAELAATVARQKGEEATA